jgi:NSS family neurotransmitter:Na+ symporter
MVIFPAVFAMGLEPTEGPSLVFSVLPSVFVGMPFGNLVSIIFFFLLAIAAITSGISLLEVVVAYFIDQRKWNRKKAVLITSVAIFAFGVPSSLSFGVLSETKLFDMTFFDHVDNFASNYLLPLGGMLTAIFVGWAWGTNSACEEIKKNNTNFYWGHVWGFLISYITPVAVFFVFCAKFF